jgi:hypothetical protein
MKGMKLTPNFITHRNLKSKGSLLFYFFYKWYTRTNILSFLDVTPSFSTHLSFQSTSFLMPSVKIVFGSGSYECLYLLTTGNLSQQDYYFKKDME